MRYIIITLALLSGLSAKSQPWMYELARKKSTQNFSFFEIQDAFNQYWKDRKVEKGKGFKQFKRWEYFMEPRVDSNGYLPYDIINAELLKLLDQSSSENYLSSQWTFIGPDQVPKQIGTNDDGGIGRINCIAFHPTDSNTMWVGAPSGGVWKTTDGGKSWNTTTDALAAIGVSDIAVNPKNPEIIYLATGDGDFGVVKTYSIGIIKSVNGGGSWQATGLVNQISDQVAFSRMLINPDLPDIMIASSSNGLYATADGWVNFSKIMSGNFKDLEFKPSSYSTIYATTVDYAGRARIYKSINGGQLFNESMTGMSISGRVNRIELAVTPANPNVVYALCSDATNNGFYALYKTTNSAVSWTLVYDNSGLNLLGWSPLGSDTGGQGSYDLSLAVSPTNENEIYVGGVNVWRSLNGGFSWSIKGLWYVSGVVGYIHADHHEFIYSPLNNALYSGNDGGIYKTYNKGETWTDLSNGLAILQIYRMAQSELDPGMIVTGNQDNGTIMLRSGEWTEIIGGDGMECFIDYDDLNTIYGTLYYGDIRKSYNGGESFDSIPPASALQGAWITPIAMHPKIPNILYAGYQKVYKTINGGSTWETLSDFQSGSNNLQVVALAPSNDNVIYIATRNNVYKSTNGGNSWNNISTGLPSQYKADIAVSETDPEKLWIVLSGYSDGNKVYRSDNGGQTWINYSEGLPNLPVNTIVYQNSSNQILYIGTDIGVYYRDAAMETWVKFGNGLPNVSVYDLKILYATKKIRAATHGRGVWEAGIYQNVSDIYTDFSVSSPAVCLNGPAVFYNQSFGNFDSLVWNFGNSATPSIARGSGPLTISWSALGQKTVSMTGYIGNLAYPVTKPNLINVISSINFIVSPDMPEFCLGDSISLYASGGYDISWDPSGLLDTATGEKITINPPESVSYEIVATSGTCSATKSLDVIVITNDDICNALLINEGQNGPYNNFCATAQPNEPVPPQGSTGPSGCESQDGWCAGELRIDNSLWFKFVAPSGGLVSINTAGFDDQIAVYEASTCQGILEHNYVLLAANDDFPGRKDYSAAIQEISGLVPGRTYWLQVDGSYGGVYGKFTVTLNYFRLSSDNSLQLVDQGIRFSVYPNPNNGTFTVSYNLKNPGPTTVRVYSITGALVFSDNFYPAAENGTRVFDLKNMSSGLYIIELVNSEGKMKRKFYLDSGITKDGI